jgi:hypothetical protein
MQFITSSTFPILIKPAESCPSTHSSLNNSLTSLTVGLNPEDFLDGPYCKCRSRILDWHILQLDRIGAEGVEALEVEL